MQKLKTKKLITKRFKITKKGKVMRKQGFARHLNSKKSSKRKRSLRRTILTKKGWAERIKKSLGK